MSHVQIFIPRVLYYCVSNIFLFKYTQNYNLKNGYVYIINGTMAAAIH